MKYILLVILLISCSSSNYVENTITIDQVSFKLPEIEINQKEILNELKKSIESYRNNCGIEPDYIFLYLDDELNIKLSKYQKSDDFKLEIIKEELKYAKGVVKIHNIPVIINYTEKNNRFFLIKKKSIVFNFESSLDGCYLDKFYEFKNEKLFLYDELFIGDIKVEQIKN